MRNYIIILLAATLCFSCNQSRIAEKTTDTTSLSIDSTTSIPADTVWTYSDTSAAYLDVTNFKILERDDTLVNFPAVTEISDIVDHQKELLSHDTRVIRKDSILEFTLENRQTISLIDNTNTEGDDYVHYYYVRSLDNIHQWEILVTYYEGLNYLLIDQRDGEKNFMCSPPLQSPDKMLLLCGSEDIFAGYDFNGFQLWRLVNNKPKLIWQKELEQWGPEEFTWASDSVVVARQVYLDQASGDSKKRIIQICVVKQP